MLTSARSEVKLRRSPAGTGAWQAVVTAIGLLVFAAAVALLLSLF